MYWAPLAAEAVLLGALLPNVNAAAAARNYEEAREEHVRSFPAPTQDLSGLSDKLKSLQGRDVRPRQAQTSASVTYTVTLAPDETCGYLSASAGAGITCDNGQNCAWEVKEADVILCGTQIKDACLESSVALNSDLCNDVCQSNEFNLLCTESDAPYCRTYIYPSGVWDYRCASTPVTAPQSVDHTYEGQNNAGFITTVLAETSTLPESVTTIPTEASTTSSDVITSTTIPSEPTHQPKKKTPIGAIVGGVVGGVAVIAFIVFGIIFFLRRKKSKTPPANQAPAQGQPPVNYVPGPADQYQQQMLQQQQMQMAMGTDTKPAMPTSPVPSDWRQSTLSGPSTAVSPVSQQGWTPQPFPSNTVSPAPAPAYEAPGHEAREPTPVYEMGSDTAKK
ncbi:hypothetical protein B0J13DRAFT_673996 [Dactylonectria estremocensis]|uniref:Mid2 domain-containing protein n=1 Tax=Dactylonectria estremocensis TaxID=1079267 RepID=A0A9P9F2Z9_9HYPO|nr:hypothetical protein B0J13DRAFT_673996 [Dactylonectria estremocensis]